jgi:hypothetical protein
MVEVASHLSWPALGAPEVTPHVVHQFGFVPGALPSDRVDLDILVEELIGRSSDSPASPPPGIRRLAMAMSASSRAWRSVGIASGGC